MRENTELYQQACGIIARVLDAAENERDALIDEACREKPALRQEVEWLYDECQRTVSFVLDGVTRLARLESIEPPPPSGLRVAAAREYAIVRELGRGGMGIVYLAERRDADYVQSVALKLLTAGAADMPEVVTRFLAERQILAELSHPNIAHLVDGGRLPDGRPFIAMEYVDGQRIDHYCAVHVLTTPQKLRLFMKVCAALHYAHQHLVIHRDIKPANIFVTAEGQPKLLDFGIARILGKNPHIVSAETMEGRTPLTLAYASPEQIEGKPLTTGTDIYSLGVLLYELLAETHPFPRDIPAVELARNIREVDARPPSRALHEQRTAPRGGATTLRWRSRSNAITGDLDAIVLKAMRKNPDERYQTAAEFADDIGCVLDGKPVSARRGEGWYRARKFVGRHRYAVGAVAFAALLVVFFGIDRAYQLKKTEAALQASEKITHYFVGIFTGATPLSANGQDISARSLLTRGAQNLKTQLAGEDAVKLKLYSALGDSLESVGAKAEANDALTAGLQLAESSPQADPLTIAQYLDALAWLRIRQGRFSDAGDFAQRTLSVLRDDDQKSRLERGMALRYLAVSKSETSAPFDEVAARFDESLATLGAAGASAQELAQTHFLYARAYMRQNRYDDAVKSLDQVLALLPSTPDMEARRASYMVTKASALQHSNRPLEAEDVFAAIRPKLDAIYQETPAELDGFYVNYAQSDILLGRYRHAVSLFDHLADLCKTQSCVEDAPHQFDRLLTHGRALIGAGQLKAAEKMFDAASDVADTMPQASSAMQKIMVRTAGAEAYTKGHLYETSLSLLNEAATFLPQLGSATPSWERLIDSERLRALIRAQRWDEAERTLDTYRASPVWKDQGADLAFSKLWINAGRQRWSDVARDLPAMYKNETALFGPCTDSAATLRRDWAQWLAQGAPLPPVPDTDVRCEE